MTSGLLARSTEAQPLNAPSPSVPVTPLIITTEPLSRTPALAASGACSRPGASILISAGMFCRSIGGAGGAALISNFSGLPLLRALPDSVDLAVGIDGYFGIDGLDPVLDAVAQIGEYDRAAADTDMLDRKRIGGLGGGRLRGGIGLPQPLASQRQIHHRADDDEFGDMRPAGPHARQRHIGLDAAGREAVVDVAVLRILQRHVVQRDVERRPQADLGSAVDGELVAGLALDPLLDLPRQEARGDADHQQQRDDDDHGANGRAGNFQCSHFDIPDRANGSYFGGPTRGRNRSGELIPETGCGSQKPKIFRAYCKVM